MAFTREAATGRVQTWFAEQDPSQLTISKWVVTEFSSALSIKLRMKHLSVEQRASAVSLFTSLRTRSPAIAPVMREHFQAAARFADQSGWDCVRVTRSMWRSRRTWGRGFARWTNASPKPRSRLGVSA